MLVIIAVKLPVLVAVEVVVIVVILIVIRGMMLVYHVSPSWLQL